MSTQDHVFNQYFLNFLKKLKTLCKNKKYESHDAREILRSIKKHYQNNDRFAPDFRAYMNEAAPHVWDTYAQAADLDQWMSEHADTQSLFKDVALSSVKTMMQDSYILHHYFTVLNIFRVDMPDEAINTIVDVLKSVGTMAKDKVMADLVSKVADDTVKVQLERIVDLSDKRAERIKTDPLFDKMAEIENTSLGRLAKEIMEEVDVSELQNSFGNGDIMSALANPDGGLVKLLGTVSQKMLTKMSTGELKQENLLQDAMKLATQMGGGDSNPLSALGDLAGMFDMSSISKMMGGGGGGGKQHKVRAMKRMARMRQKLDNNKKKENVSVHVEES